MSVLAQVVDFAFDLFGALIPTAVAIVLALIALKWAKAEGWL
jgi:hypothetical protein